MSVTSRRVFEFGPYRLDEAEARLDRSGEPVRLPPKTLELLIALVKRPGRLVTKADLMAEVWPGVSVEESNLSVNISTLRKALDDEAGQRYVETVPERGYRFVEQVREVEAEALPAAPVDGPRPTINRRGLLAAVIGLALATGAAAWWIGQRPMASGTLDVRSLLIVPMVALQSTEDQAHLGMGMAEALTVRLGGINSLRVSPSSLVRPGEDVFAAARRIDVDAVLTGSIQREGERLRVVASLVSSGNQSQIWAGRFDEPFTDIFAVQDTMAARIATSLVSDLPAADQKTHVRPMTPSAEAYDLYLKGRARWARRSPESIRAAIALYQEAIKIDPSFALAHAGLADAYTITASGLPADIRFPLARVAATTAIALDASLAEAHTALAFLSYKAEWDWAQADEHFRRAIALDSGYALAYHWYGEMLGLVGRTDDSVAAFERARALDPWSVAIRADLARMLTRAGRAAEALVLVDEGLQIDPREFRLHRERALAMVALGREDEAFHHFLQNRILSGTPADQVAELRRAHESGGLRGFREQEIVILKRQLEGGRPTPLGFATQIAVVYGALGDREATLEWLERCAENREDGVLGMRVNREYDFLREDPRFQALMRRVRFP